MTHISQCISFVNTAEGLGATIPKLLRDCLKIAATINTALDDLDPHRAILDAGSGLTADTVRAAAVNAAMIANSGDFLAQARQAQADRFAEHLRGKAGEDLVRSLRPRFDAAAKAIAGLRYPTGTSKAELVDLGNEAADDWRAAGRYRADLDLIWNSIVEPMVSVFDTPKLDVFPVPDRPELLRRIAWVVDASHRPLSTGQAAALYERTTDPGGWWRTLVTTGGAVLRLNTPSETQSAVDEFAEAWDAANQAAEPMSYDEYQTGNYAAKSLANADR